MKRIKSVLLLALVLVVLALPVSASSYSRTLHYGHRGEDVTKLQGQLRQMGYYNIPVDGIYGLVTERAVINFQIDHSLRIDGFVGPETQKLLNIYDVKFNGQQGNSSETNTSQTSQGNTSFNQDDLYWLARIIEAEAGGEPYQGKVAVANVILNRVKSKDFPNTIYQVIFEYSGGLPQFSPVHEGTIYNTPSQESIKAAKDALNGNRPVGDATYFFNPSKAAGSWIVNNKIYMTSISGHAFYR